MLIDDGKGRGYKAEVDSENRLRVISINQSLPAHVSEEEGETYSWTAVSADINTGDTALLVCNNSTSKKLLIEKIYVWGDVAAQFKIHIPSYPTLAGTGVVGVNLNSVSGNAADASAYADETGNTFAATNVITTVRNTYYVRGNGDDLVDIAAAGKGEWIDYNGMVVLGYHGCIAIDIIGESAAFECTIIGTFHA